MEVRAVREEKESEEKKSERKSQKTEDQSARKGIKVTKHSVFPNVLWPSGEMRQEKLRADVVRSTFGSQNAQNTSVSEHFWRLRSCKSARRKENF